MKKSPARPSLEELEAMLRDAKAKLEASDPKERALWEKHLANLQRTLEHIRSQE